MVVVVRRFDISAVMEGHGGNNEDIDGSYENIGNLRLRMKMGKVPLPHSTSPSYRDLAPETRRDLRSDLNGLIRCELLLLNIASYLIDIKRSFAVKECRKLACQVSPCLGSFP